MKRVWTLVLALCFLLSGCTQTSAVSPFRKFKDEDAARSISDASRKFYDEKKLTGLSVGIIRDGKVAFFNFGKTAENGAPITEDTRFEIGELTEPITATILASLSLDPTVYKVYDKDNKIKFDRKDRADSYLPYDIKLEKDGTPVLLWQLAAQVSGLPYLPDNMSGSETPYADYSQFELVEALQRVDFQAVPGERYSASDFGYGLLGWIMGRVTGTQFDKLMQSRVLSPLGMDHTAFTLTDAQEAARAKPHTALGKEAAQRDYDVLAPSGGLKSTSHDLIRFVAGNLGELDLEWKTLISALEETQKQYYEGDGHTVGLGFEMTQLDGNALYTQTGATGGYGGYLAFIPKTGTGVVVLCNNATPVDELGAEVLTLLQP